MTIDFFRLSRGDVLPEISLRIDAEDLRAYLEATGEADAASADLWTETVPPLALGAFALSALMEQMPLAPGTLHAGQEFDFRRAVAAGESLSGRVTVDQRAERRGSLLTALSLELRSGDDVVATARTTLVNPVEDGEA